MATFWGKAAHSVDHMFSFVILDISRFSFEGWVWFLIASVPGLYVHIMNMNIKDLSDPPSFF